MGGVSLPGELEVSLPVVGKCWVGGAANATSVIKDCDGLSSYYWERGVLSSLGSVEYNGSGAV